MSRERLKRALSIRQPYVSQILAGTKRHEYRSRQTHVRGRVYIYASKKPVPYSGCLDLPRGLILGSVEIFDCHRRPGFSMDDWAWVLRDPEIYKEPLKPLGKPQPGFWYPRFNMEDT